MSKVHAINAPSGAPRWIPCPGSTGLAKDIADTGSDFAAEGTCAHEFAALALEHAKPAARYIGTESKDAPGWTFDEDMAVEVQKYVDYVRALADGDDVALFAVEVELDMQSVVPGCFGTSDTVILKGRELIVIDLKYGRGVRVDAEGNEQLMLYALGAYLEYGTIAEIDTVRIVVHQPRLDHVDEWECTVDTLKRFGELAGERGTLALQCYEGTEDPLQHLDPGEEQCRFCRAKATCPALAQAVAETTAAQFDDLTQTELLVGEVNGAPSLEQQMAKVGLIEDWCKAVRAATESALLAGKPVPGWKLVQGRQGPRKWKDEAEAETLLRKTFRLKVEDAYDLSVKSPTSIEKLHKAGVIGARQWPKVEALITRAAGSVSVAPESDKRAAYVPTVSAEDFEALPAESTAPVTEQPEPEGAELI